MTATVLEDPDEPLFDDGATDGGRGAAAPIAPSVLRDEPSDQVTGDSFGAGNRAGFPDRGDRSSGDVAVLDRLPAEADDVDLEGATVALADSDPPPKGHLHDEGVIAEPKNVAPDPEVGDWVGGYELMELLGKGGAGSVFRARRSADGTVVALKVLAAAKLNRARVVQRFFDEARTASMVKHEALVNLVEFIEEEAPRRLAYAMEYVDGYSLRTKLQREHALNMTDAIDIARQICQAIRALHDAGIIHRDLKPENIMLIEPTEPNGRILVKVLDFGVAKFLSVDALGQNEAPGTFVGTPRYMAPEQAAGGSVDARSDLFAVGVMLFEMTTGVRPHEGDSLKAVVMAKLKGAPRITVNPEREVLPQELTDVVDSCLKLQPDLRPESAAVVAATLEEAYTVLSAVGPIRVVPEGGVVREQTGVHAVEEELVVPSSLTPMDGPQRTATYVLPGPSVTHTSSLLPETTARDPSPNTPEPVRPMTPAQGPTAPVIPALPLPPAQSPNRALMKLVAVLATLVIGAVGVGYLVFELLAEDGSVYVVSPRLAEPPGPPAPPSIDQPHVVRLSTHPEGAAVLVEGQEIGETPYDLTLASGVARMSASLVREGYEPFNVRITRSTKADLAVTLMKAVPAGFIDLPKPGSEPKAPAPARRRSPTVKRTPPPKAAPAMKSTPAVKPAPKLAPVSKPTLASKPVPKPKPSPAVAPRSSPTPAPRATPAPKVKPAPKAKPAPEPAPKAKPAPEPKPAPKPAPEAKPAPEPKPAAKPKPEPPPREQDDDDYEVFEPEDDGPVEEAPESADELPDSADELPEAADELP